MKRLLYTILALCILFVAGFYIIIPNQITISKAEQVESSDRIIWEFLNNSNKRHQWWPKDTSEKSLIADTLTMELNGFKYEFNSGGLRSANVLISGEDFKTNSVITWENVAKSTYKIAWRAAFQTSKNPVERFLQYKKAHQVKDNMTLALENLLTHLVDSKNIYGLSIERSTVKDTILATSTFFTPYYPETKKIYALINEVKKYAVKNGAKPVNVPMLNVSKNSKGEYQTMIALPINKNIKTSNSVKVNQMVPGNILVTEIKGGPGKIAEGFNQMSKYIIDFKHISPAMPFESLVTDRSAESDTSKWLTKIYYPIF